MRVSLRQGPGYEPEVRIVDIQVQQRCRSWSLVRSLELRIWMIEYVLSIHSELQCLGLRNLDRFRQACIKSPSTGSLDHALAKSSSRSRQWILQKNLAGFRIRNRAESAETP